MASEIDPVIAKRMDQSFADHGEVLRQQSASALAGDIRVAELLRNSAVQFSVIAGAKAAQGLAGNILDQRSAGMQPQAAGGPQAVVPKV